MKVVFYILAILIAYGSFYPFNFDLSVIDEARINALFDFNITRTTLSDTIANIVLFVPFGFLFLSTHRHNTKLSRIGLFVLYGFIYAFIIQVLQLWMPARLPWGGDAILNTIGFGLGYGFALALNNRFTASINLVSDIQKVSFAIGLGLIFMKLAPFAPSLDLGVLKDNIKHLIAHPEINAFWLFENTVTWLVAFYLLSQAKITALRNDKLFMLLSAVLTIKFFIVANQVNLSQLLGGVLAFVLWIKLRDYISPLLLFSALLLSVLGNAFYPFELREVAGSFNWLPFIGSLKGNVLLNILAVTKKLFLYAGLVWLLTLQTKRIGLSTILCSLAIFTSEYLQRFMTNSVSESTDAALVLFIGFILSRLSLNENESSISQNKSFNNPAPQVPYPSALSSYIPGLDGLRGIAALSVFIVHFQQFTHIGGQVGPFDFERWMVNGNTGVALFFTLSGFLLSIPFWRSYQTAKMPNIKRYFASRIVRIVPIYYLCFFGLIALKSFSGAEVNFNNIISHLFFLHNLKDYQVMSLNPPFWTLAVEVQFYILLPLIFFVISKLNSISSRLIVLIIMALSVVSYQLLMGSLESYTQWPITVPLIWPFGIELTSIKSAALKYSTLAHLPHFLIGVLAASLYLGKSKIKSANVAESLFWLSCIGLIAILATTIDTSLQIQYGRYNFPYVPLLLGLVVLTAPSTVLAKKLLELPILVWVGSISYGIYIFHYPIQKATLQGFKYASLDLDSNVALYAGISLLLTLFVSHLSFKIIEQPLMNWLKRRNPPVISQQTIVIENNVEPKSPNNKKSSRYPLLTLTAITGCGALAYFVYSSTSPASSIEQASWANDNYSVIFDHHAHTDYSDGSLPMSTLVEHAYFNGCDAMAITDHTNTLSSLTHEKLDTIESLRKAYPGLMILAGVEIGMLSYDQREHVNLLAHPNTERRLLPEILATLSDSVSIEKDQQDHFLIQRINQLNIPKTQIFTIYNHPSRKDIRKEENLDDLEKWNKNTPFIQAYAGAPGHQKNTPIGSYRDLFRTEDRWDPAISEVGGTWDKALAEGIKVWGAIASSDFHNANIDYYPCEFARIHVDVPSKDYAGLFAGLHAGTFWADHGKLLSAYNFSIELPNTGDVAKPGATITLPTDELLLTINANFKRNKAYKEDFIRFDVISNCGSEETQETRYYFPPGENKRQVFVPLSSNKKACYVRSRIVKETVKDNDLAAYSNPIMVKFK
ncbi:acyltransferase family protein [Alteromonas sp. 5E99-2]|uniref:acyltransferase family protein n=1 Tax=Alteromonas sp. 5E99-2 TaxID=2817683 RepID=UPI001A9839F6|nr:acyltransferase family protein [Alteromonas sp. 5E99-2]MBO1254749.1 acyltransferase family protein [Alteromonas sp. 5E99-2]